MENEKINPVNEENEEQRQKEARAAEESIAGLKASSMVFGTPGSDGAAVLGEGDRELTRAHFNIVLGLVMLWGFGVTTLICATFGPSLVTTLSVKIILIGYAVLALGGVFITKKSGRPLISFLGYNMVVLPMGFVLCMILNAYSASVIARACAITGLTTIAMTILAVQLPKVFLKIGPALLIALVICAALEGLGLLFGWWKMSFDIPIALIFSGYIGYDFARAQQYPATLDSAIDAACDLYMDVINLLIRLLPLLASKDDD